MDHGNIAGSPPYLGRVEAMTRDPMAALAGYRGLSTGINVIPRKWDSRHAGVLRDLDVQREELLKLRISAEQETKSVLMVYFDDATANEMIKRADEIRDALAPFDSGVRQG